MKDSSIAVILEGLPIVPPSQIAKMSSFVLHRLNDANPGDYHNVLMLVAGQ